MTEPEAAVAMVQAHADRKSILLIRRAEREGDSWSGHWSFPGGWRSPADADPLATALRELEEECGVHLAREQMERPLPPTLARRKVGRWVLVAPFVFHVEHEFSTVLNPHEAVASLWLPVDRLLDPHQHALRPAPGRPPHMLFPGVDLNGQPLWGFTYRLITEWLALIPHTRPVEAAGFESAQQVLEFLLSHGCSWTADWADRPEGIKAATVSGEIPVHAVLAHFSPPRDSFPVLNCLEVCPDYIRIVGPAWEEYFIYNSEHPPIGV